MTIPRCLHATAFHVLQWLPMEVRLEFKIVMLVCVSQALLHLIISTLSNLPLLHRLDTTAHIQMWQGYSIVSSSLLGISVFQSSGIILSAIIT